jgi:hypothetical protein
MDWICKAAGGVLAGLVLLVGSVHADTRAPKVAVTDLAFEERMTEYFPPEQGGVKGGQYIDRGELRKFSADIKGAILKSNLFELVQGRLTNSKDSEKLYDIIGRIKQGQYQGADYVLFGTLNSVQFREEDNPIDNTNTVSHTLSLELVGEFSLISTRSFKVKSSFTAMGTGQDVKLLSARGGHIVLNRGKVVAEVSKSLGDDVSKQLVEQLSGMSADEDSRALAPSAPKPDASRDGVIIFR